MKKKYKKTRFSLSKSKQTWIAPSSTKGFTLIELLIVGVLIVSITGILGGTLIASLRGGTKSKITNEVSQNGSYVLSVISQDVVAASEVVSVGGSGNTGCIDTSPPPPNTSWGPGTEVVLKKDNGDEITFACEAHPPGVENIKREFQAADGSPPKINWLLDASQVEVAAGTCEFVCKQAGNDEYAVPVIDVAFTLKQKGTSTSSEDTANSTFRTSAVLRNFRPF